MNTIYRGLSKEPDIMENLKYKTVKDGIDLYLDAQTLANRASHKNTFFTKKKIERDANKG